MSSKAPAAIGLRKRGVLGDVSNVQNNTVRTVVQCGSGSEVCYRG